MGQPMPSRCFCAGQAIGRSRVRIRRDAQRRHEWAREEELQAKITELDADYESVLRAAVLI